MLDYGSDFAIHNYAVVYIDIGLHGPHRPRERECTTLLTVHNQEMTDERHRVLHLI